MGSVLYEITCSIGRSLHWVVVGGAGAIEKGGEEENKCKCIAVAVLDQSL